jgi:hypothetical protein
MREPLAEPHGDTGFQPVQSPAGCLRHLGGQRFSKWLAGVACGPPGRNASLYFSPVDLPPRTDSASRLCNPCGGDLSIGGSKTPTDDGLPGGANPGAHDTSAPVAGDPANDEQRLLTLYRQAPAELRPGLLAFAAFLAARQCPIMGA